MCVAEEAVAANKDGLKDRENKNSHSSRKAEEGHCEGRGRGADGKPGKGNRQRGEAGGVRG